MPRFVPCRVSHLTQELAQGLPSGDRPRFWELTRVVEALYHHYGGAQSRLVEELYAPFDPDSDTVPSAGRPGHPEGAPVAQLLERLEEVFARANFNRAESSTLLTAADEEVLDQLAIEAQGIEQLAVYHRGIGSKAIRLRRARRMFRLEEQEVPTYRRVAIVVRTEADPEVQVKLFKDVPQRDLELLLPTVRVKMKLLDKLKLSGSGGAAAISAWKTIRMAYRFTPTIAKLAAVPFKLLLLPVLVLVGGIYGGKTVLDYSKIRASYVTALAEHLYAITMASNLSALARLSLMAGEEETKEVVLAYGLLLQALDPEGGPGLTPSELRVRAEAFLWDRYRARVGFDIDDALEKLRELELIHERDGEGRLFAVPLDAALRKVDAVWDELYAAPSRAERRLRRRAVRA